MRSKQTGQVGNSINDGVGGAKGLVDEGMGALKRDRGAGVNGSMLFCGKLLASDTSESGLRNSTDLIKTTWQFSGSMALNSLPL